MDKLQANLILEILGRPPEHLVESLNAIISKLASEKGCKILEKKVHEPLPVQDSDNLFTSFAEITVEFDSIEIYTGILFAYMPANAEIISPEEFIIRNDDLTFIGSKILGRLHDYDSIAKRLISERDSLFAKLKEVAPQLFSKEVYAQNNSPPSNKTKKKQPAKKKKSKK